MKINLIFLVYLLFVLPPVVVNAQQVEDRSQKFSFHNDNNSQEHYIYVDNLNDLKKAISDQNLELNIKLAMLENLVITQSFQINDLNNNKSSNERNSGMEFAEWTGILLASVAIILTVLAIVIAIVSFYGYNKIISSSNDIAVNKATEITNKIVKEKIHETTKIEIIRLFEDERLDDFLLEAAGKVIYRGIGIPDHEENSKDQGGRE